jgi:myosin-crossreactive antigen
MQIKNQTFVDFAERTDSLASVLNCTVQDLTEILGFSRASLFAYRTGKVKISDKAWRKLADAESRAGKPPKLYETRIGQEGTPSAIVQEKNESILVQRVERLELELAELKAVVLKIRNAVNHRER